VDKQQKSPNKKLELSSFSTVSPSLGNLANHKEISKRIILEICPSNRPKRLWFFCKSFLPITTINPLSSERANRYGFRKQRIRLERHPGNRL
jgi:hypothetical protein